MYAENAAYGRYAERMAGCGQSLTFGEISIDEHDSKLKLTNARFCRFRHCPICAWRKSLALKARFLRNLPAYLANYPNYSYIHICLTVKNPDMADLKDTIKRMNNALKKLLKRKELLPVIKGYIKSIEVTRSRDGKPHPHIHFIGAVEHDYFTGEHYINQKTWRKLWQSCLEVDYEPVVNIKKVKPKKGDHVVEITDESTGEVTRYEGEAAALIGGVIEVIKYALKPEDEIKDVKFLYGITDQLRGMRFQETGGCFKDILKDRKRKKTDQEVTDDEMMLKDSGNKEKCGKKRFTFNWIRKEDDYVLGRIFEEEGPPCGGYFRDDGG